MRGRWRFIYCDILPALIRSTEYSVGFSKSPRRNFLLHWSHLGLQYERMLAPDNDASTGSLETPDAPRSLCTKSKKLCTTKPNWFYALMVSCMKQSFSMQRPTNCQGSVPFPTFALFTLQASSFVSSGQWERWYHNCSTNRLRLWQETKYFEFG